MKIFQCSNCANIVHFENTSCEACGRRLGYRPGANLMTAMASAGEAGGGRRFCANAELEACNWLIDPDEPGAFCRACRHNGVIPDLSGPGHLERWRRIEDAKRRMIYSLLRWGLPLPTRREDPQDGLRFEFLADGPSGKAKVMTGHDDGVITIALAEADDVERESRRAAMGEPYRTLLGHFRHEIGHFYWNLLVRDGGRLDECRAVFGDDRRDYAEALSRHHDDGPPADWTGSYVSSYATMHPWEDFAETWAHCMHIVDTLETAAAFGLSLGSPGVGSQMPPGEAGVESYRAQSFDAVLSTWLPVALAVNAINRSMGSADLYPFVISPPVAAKLAYVHGVIRACAAPR